MITCVGYDALNNEDGCRYAWKDKRFKFLLESAAFNNRTKGNIENISGYTTSVSAGCILRAQKMACAFCRTGNLLPFGGTLTYKEIAKQNIFMVLVDMYNDEYPELNNKHREFAYMGQGEPGYSYSQVRMAIELTNDVMKELGQKVHRHIFATAGIPESIDNYINDSQRFFSERVTLHFSLHATLGRDLIMPINKLYDYTESLKQLNRVIDVTGEKPCIGIMLFNNFSPKGSNFEYSNSISNVMNILEILNPEKCRLSFCEYNPDEVLGSAEEYPEIEAIQLLNEARERGFEAKLFSSFGREKQTACGMLGGKKPEHIASRKWKELDCYANCLIEKYS